MAKKEYFKLIYLRQADEDGDYWYAVHSISRHAEVAVINNSTIRGVKDKLLTFASEKDAQAWIDSGSLPNMGGVWEIVSKWVPKPVSSAQRSLSKQYCQKKRQLAGIASMMATFCTSNYTRASLLSIVEEESYYLDTRYKAALKEITEKKND